MLLNTMNHKEISREVIQDNTIITNSSTMYRLVGEYYNERQKAKVKSDDVYPKYYPIKTHAKNNWHILIEKDILKEKYIKPGDIDIIAFTYYYSNKAIRVFQPFENGSINVFNGHLFSRYRERMELDIPNTMDVIKLFNKQNITIDYRTIPVEEGKINTVGIVNDGFLLGEYIEEDKWYLNKTFIAKSILNSRVSAIERTTIDSIKNLILKIDKEKEKERHAGLMKLYKSLGGQWEF